LVAPLRETISFDPDALIVAAGMDGVLPGVVSGLIPLPVVALPTSTGYGFGGEGLGALTTMLQACAPGIAVVNIDNGIGAGIMAGRIANRAAAQRSASS
jgi:NCAIR mutase (PurE)-related protein